MKNYEFISRGTLHLVSRLPPPIFFLKLRANAFPNPLFENSEINTESGDQCYAQGRRVSLSYFEPFPRYLTGNFGGFPPCLKICKLNFPKNLIECIGGGLQRNLGLLTILIEPFWRKCDFRILPQCSVLKIFFVENKSVAYQLSDRFRRPLKNQGNILGRIFSTPKIQEEQFYMEYKNGWFMLNRSPRINFQKQQTRHSPRVEVIAVFTKFLYIGGGI